MRRSEQGRAAAGMRTKSAKGGVTVFEGNLAAVALADVLQVVCNAGHDAVIEVWRGDDLAGKLSTQRGQLTSCAMGRLTGKEAFFALVGVADGYFRVVRRPASRGVPTIPAGVSCQALLLEAAQYEDDRRRGREDAPTPLELTEADLTEDLVDTVPAPVSEVVPLAVVEARAHAPALASVPPPVPPRVPTPVPPPVLAAVPPLVPTAVVAAAVPAPAPPPVVATTPVPTREADPPVVATTPVPTREPDPPDETFDALLRDATTAYLRRDFPTARRLFEACGILRPTDRRIRHNLQRLRERD